MPDWRKPEDYEYLKSIDRHEWAWEFLRRNHEYRKAYFAVIALAEAQPRDPNRQPGLSALIEAAGRPFGLMISE